MLEKSRMQREVGAAISLQPNASKIIAQWGIDAFLARVEPLHDEAFRILDVDGNLVNEIRIDTTKLFGADRVVYHRQDLHAALRAAVSSPELPGQPADVRASAVVVACNPDRGTVTLASVQSQPIEVLITDGNRNVRSRSRTRARKQGSSRRAPGPATIIMKIEDEPLTPQASDEDDDELLLTGQIWTDD